MAPKMLAGDRGLNSMVTKHERRNFLGYLVQTDSAEPTVVGLRDPDRTLLRSEFVVFWGPEIVKPPKL